MYYLIDDDPDLMYGEEDFEQMVEKYVTKEYCLKHRKEEFDDYLDEHYHFISVCDQKYWASRIFKELDEMRYDREYDWFVDQVLGVEQDRAIEDLSLAKPGQSVWLHDRQVFCYE